RHGELRALRVRARAFPRPHPVSAQRERHPDAHDAAGVRRDRGPYRREAERRPRTGDDDAPPPRRERPRPRGAALPRPHRQPGAVPHLAGTAGPTDSAGRARPAHQRSGLRRGGGGASARIAARPGRVHGSTTTHRLMPFIPYQECLRRLREQRAAGRPIIGAGAGTGISAKFAERGGVDIIIIYNSGRYRMAGRGSNSGLMPYGDANAIVVDMAREVLPVVKDTPVLAGVCGTDPFRMMRVFLRELKEMGFDGVQNFPTVGLIDGNFRRALEETGMSIRLEVEMIALAHELGMLTCPYVFDEEQARWFTEAGADIVVAHVHTTVGGSIGVDTAMTLDEAVDRVQAIHD